MQGIRQAQGNMYQMDGCQVVVYCGVASLQVFIQVCDEDHQGVLRGWECHQVVSVTEASECLLLTLVDPTGVVL